MAKRRARTNNCMGCKMEELNQEQETGAPNTEVKQYSEADLKAMLEKETAGLKSKVDELLGEKKSASQKAREATEQAENERIKRAKEAEDFRSLYESSESKRNEIENEYNTFRSSIRAEKRNHEAYKLASEMAQGANIELLSEFISRRLDIGEDGKLQVLNADGSPTIQTVKDLKKEFETSGRFDALLKGVGSIGGGAIGGKTGSASFSGKDLSKMTKAEKIEYYRNKREG